MAFHLRTLLVSFLALLYSGWVAALGLGGITLNSALNEPLDAQVALLNIGELSQAELLVNLATLNDFERAGVEREFYLVDLRFTADLSNPAKPFIRISSTKPIREPYLNFLIELQWPTGRMLREYTLFLDIPVFAAEQARGKSQAASAVNSERQRQTSGTSRSQYDGRGSAATSGSGNEYRVRNGDTLWGVAQKFRPEDSSVQQTMQAIYERNTDAFVNGDMNMLRKDAVLGVPAAVEIRSVSKQVASRSVAESVEELQSRLGARELVSDSPTESVRQVDAEPKGLLRLSAPDADGLEGAAGMDAADVGELTTEVLQNELAIAREELSKSTRDNVALRERLAKLEEQLATMSRLVEFSDDELSAIQEGLVSTEDMDSAEPVDLTSADAEADGGLSGQALDKAALETSGDHEQLPSAGATGVDAAVVDTNVADTNVADSVVDTTATSAPVAAEEAPVGGILAYLTDRLAFIGGIIAIVLAIVFLLARRRSEDDSEDLGVIADFEPSSIGTAAQVGTAPIEKQALGPLTADKLDIDEGDLLFGAESDTETRYPAQSEFGGEDNGAQDDGDVDPLGEADIYLSLGNFAEAEEIIERALLVDPDDSRLQLKLLDLFSAQNDLVRFDEHYPELVALGDRRSIQSADRMRRALTGEVDDFEEGLDDLDLEMEEESFNRPREVFDLDLELPEELARIDTDEGDEEDGVDDDIDDLTQAITSASYDSPADTVENTVGDAIAELDLDLDSDLDLDLDSDMEETLELPGLAEPAEAELSAELEELEENVAEELSEFDNFDIDDDADFLVESDEIATQLELAQAYIDMGDHDGANDILKDVITSGDSAQQEQAEEIMKQISARR